MAFVAVKSRGGNPLGISVQAYLIDLLSLSLLRVGKLKIEE